MDMKLYKVRDKKTLAAIRLISRESNSAARSWLFRSLTLNFSSMKSVNEAVESYTAPQNNLVHYVHEIVAQGSGRICNQRAFDNLESILARFPAVRRVV